MRSRKKWAVELVFLLAVLGGTAYVLLSSSDLRELARLLSAAERGWWSLGLGLVVLFILGESLVLHDIMGALGTSHRLSHCFLYSFVGFFFSCITPSAGGGQPAQVYFMKKDGISASVSVPVLMLVTITYKLVLVLYGLGVLVFRPAQVTAALQPVRLWCLLGLGLNVAFVGLYLLLVFRPGLVQRLLELGLRLWEKLTGMEKPHRRELLAAWIGQYGTASVCFRRHWGMVLRVLLLTVLQRSVLFAVTYFTMRSFGCREASLGTVVVLQAMISMGTDLLPLPGGMGASETMFLQIFPAVCGAELTLPVLLVSRGISYYGQLLISAGFTAAAVFILGKARRGRTQ